MISKMKSVINSYELFLYYCIWISAIAFSCLKYIESQNGTAACFSGILSISNSDIILVSLLLSDFFKKYPTFRFQLPDLVPGWRLLGRQKDVSDVEWTCLIYYLKNSWFYLLINFFVSESLRKCNNQILKSWYLLSSLLYIILNFGAKQLLMVLIQPVIFFLLLVCGGKQVSIWITSIILIVSYDNLKYGNFLWQYWEDANLQDDQIYILLYGLGWTVLRCISFSLDYAEKQEKKILGDKCTDNSSLFQAFINMFSYVLYLPVLFFGPIILYEEFENSFQFKIESLWQRVKRFTMDIILFGIYIFLMELALHYVYFCVLHIKPIKEFPSVALSGGGLWMGFQFQVKYVVSYGTMGALARLDNMEAPPTARCIARIHVYSLMWRYFDVGLYKFLVKYIYKPSCRTLCTYFNMPNSLIKMIASLCTFLFIYVWHGIALHIFIWSTLNYCSILLEQLAKVISTTNWYKNFKVNILKTEGMEARLIASLSAPLLTVSAVSNFYLFGGTEFGSLYVALLQWPALHNLMIVLISTYCCAHISMALSDVPSRTDIKRRRIKVE